MSVPRSRDHRSRIGARRSDARRPRMDFFLCYPTPCKARARTPAPSVGRCTGTSRPDLGVRAQLHRRRSARASRRGERAARRSMWQVDPAGSSSVLRRAWSRPQRGGGKVRVGKKGRSTDELKGVRGRGCCARINSGSPGFYSARFGSAVLADGLSASNSSFHPVLPAGARRGGGVGRVRRFPPGAGAASSCNSVSGVGGGVD